MVWYVFLATASSEEFPRILLFSHVPMFVDILLGIYYLLNNVLVRHSQQTEPNRLVHRTNHSVNTIS